MLSGLLCLHLFPGILACQPALLKQTPAGSKGKSSSVTISSQHSDRQGNLCNNSCTMLKTGLPA